MIILMRNFVLNESRIRLLHSLNHIEILPVALNMTLIYVMI